MNAINQIFFFSFFHYKRFYTIVVNLGSTLMNETEFYDWVKRIQSLRQDAFTVDDDPRQDFVAAFRVFDSDNNGFITKVIISLAI